MAILCLATRRTPTAGTGRMLHSVRSISTDRRARAQRRGPLHWWLRWHAVRMEAERDCARGRARGVVRAAGVILACLAARCGPPGGARCNAGDQRTCTVAI